MWRQVSASAALVCLCATAHAADAGPAALPTFAQESQAALSSTGPSPWSGLHVGSEVFVIARKGGRGLVGGGADIGYDHEFSNRLVLGVDASTGFTPFSFGRGAFRGYDYGAASLKLGYDMGRLMPYVTTGLVLARPNGRPGGLSPGDSVNDLFDGRASLKAAGILGAGFDYAVTNNFHVGASVSVVNGPGFVGP